MSAANHLAPDAEFVGKNRAGLVRNVGLGLAAIGLLLSIGGLVVNPGRWVHGYLVGFIWVLTVALGGLIFVMLQHLAKAGWSVAPRRSGEWLAGGLQWAWLLFIPIAVLAGKIWSHWMGMTPADAEIWKKHGYLNVPFFAVRAVVYLVVFFLVARFYTRWSRKQDESGDPAITAKLQLWSGPLAFVVGYAITFAGFDWLMSLDPSWFSTIFGMYVIGGCMVSGFAAIALIQIWLQKTKVLNRISTVEHRHDLGKLIFAFTIFWTYIAFAQFFLIWYANIPEETSWFIHRWFTESGAHSGWMGWSLALLFLQFWIPFFLLLSRHPKRSFFGLTLGAIIVLVAHYIDIYWIVMPNFYPEPQFGWMDLGGFFLPFGLFVTWIGLRAARDPAYPLKDPRVHEAMALVNL